VESRLLPAFGAMPVEGITSSDVEKWRASLTGLSNRSKNKLLVVLHGIFRRAQTVYGLGVNPLARVGKHPQRRTGDVDVFSPEEVWALVRAAGSEQDGVLFLTAAFTGLRRGALLALRWRDVDFAGATIRVRASYSSGHLGDGTTASKGRHPSAQPALARGDRAALPCATGTPPGELGEQGRQQLRVCGGGRATDQGCRLRTSPFDSCSPRLGVDALEQHARQFVEEALEEVGSDDARDTD
jgi:hypothetical protein